MMKKNGMTVTSVDRKPFIDATKGVYEKLGYTALRVEVEKLLK